MRPGLKAKIINIQRYASWHSPLALFNNIRISEFPKSGGTWLCQMMAHLLQVPFPRHAWLPLNQSIEHAHYPGPSHKRTIVLVRDGRDVFTSAYFHFLIENELKPSGLVSYWKDLSGIEDVHNVIENMPQFIKTFTEKFKIGGQKVSWSDHVMSYDYSKDHIHLCRYEDLKNNTVDTLKRILEWSESAAKNSIESAIEQYSFSRLSGREAGTENRSSFLRKGVSGDWKNYFSQDAQDVFNEFHGNAMTYLGYYD